LVVSLQSVPWQAGVGKPKVSGTETAKGKAKAIEIEDESEDDMEEVEVPRLSAAVKGKGKAIENNFPEGGYRLDGGSTASTNDSKTRKGKAKPVINLRKTKSKGHTLGSSSSPKPRRLGMCLFPASVFLFSYPCSNPRPNCNSTRILDRSLFSSRRTLDSS
jgi:xeroderma pigmentosum group C-complementing protein